MPFEFEKSILLCVANETLNREELVVKWQLRDANARVLRQEEETITVEPLSSYWLSKVSLPDVKIYEEYVSFAVYRGGERLSEGTVIFSYPKYFRYENPELTISHEGDYITVSSKAYARSVEILNETEDLILSDNYFDLNGDSKTVKILSGDAKGLRVRSVFDIH